MNQEENKLFNWYGQLYYDAAHVIILPIVQLFISFVKGRKVMAPDNRLKLEARKNEEKTSKTKPKGQTELHLKSFRPQEELGQVL